MGGPAEGWPSGSAGSSSPGIPLVSFQSVSGISGGFPLVGRTAAAGSDVPSAQSGRKERAGSSIGFPKRARLFLSQNSLSSPLVSHWSLLSPMSVPYPVSVAGKRHMRWVPGSVTMMGEGEWIEHMAHQREVDTHLSGRRGGAITEGRS